MTGWQRQNRIAIPGIDSRINDHLICNRKGHQNVVGKGKSYVQVTLGQEVPWRGAWQPTPVFLPGESPWTEESGRLQSMGSQRVRHNQATKYIQ